jgi:hypothetical protein
MVDANAERRCQVIEPYFDWLIEWNAANDSELDFVMDKLDGVIVGVIGDCEIEGIDTTELRVLLIRHRSYKSRIIERRMDVAEQLDWLLKRITGERLSQSQKSDATEKDEAKTNSRAQPDHAITTWFRANGHKYDNKKLAVAAYAEIHGGNETQLYNQLDNQRNRLKPNKPS